MTEVSHKLQFAAGLSDEDHIAEAMDEAIGAVADTLSGAADFVAVFATAHHTGGFEQIAQQVAARLKPAACVGVSAGGVLGGTTELQYRAGLSVIGAKLCDIDLHAFDSHSLSWPDFADDPEALRQVIVGPVADPKLVLLFADPYSVPLVRMLPAINAALPGVPVVGGMASSGRSPQENRLLIGDRVAREGVAGVTIGGNIQVDTLVSQGCRPIGRPMVITAGRNNMVQELGGRPALKAIESMIEKLDPIDRALLERGLLIGRVIDEYKERFGRGDFLVRNIIGADRAAGLIYVADLVRPGQTIQFHLRDAATAEEDLRLLLQTMQIDGPPAGALLASCNGRGAELFDAPGVESGLIEAAPGGAPLGGFFAAGEIGPVGNENFVHGFTASLAAFRTPATPVKPEDG